MKKTPTDTLQDVCEIIERYGSFKIPEKEIEGLLTAPIWESPPLVKKFVLEMLADAIKKLKESEQSS